MNLIERANRYYANAAPHIKEREGCKLIKELIGLVNAMKSCTTCKHNYKGLGGSPCYTSCNNQLSDWELKND